MEGTQWGVCKYRQKRQRTGCRGEEEGERCWQKVLGGIVPGGSSLFCATLTSRLERQASLLALFNALS